MNRFERPFGWVNGDHHDTKGLSIVVNRRRNQPKRLTDLQIRNVLARYP